MRRCDVGMTNQPIVADSIDRQWLPLFSWNVCDVVQSGRSQGALRGSQLDSPRIGHRPSLRRQTAFRTMNTRAHVRPRHDDGSVDLVAGRVGVNLSCKLCIWTENLALGLAYRLINTFPASDRFW